MKRGKYVFIFVAFTVFACITLLTVISVSHNENTFGQEQWAIKNIGKTVNGMSCKKNVDINVRNLEKSYLQGDGILIGIVDTGMWMNEAIKRKVLFVNPKEMNNELDDDKNGYIDDLSGWNFYGNNSNVYIDELSDYHGTMVGSIIVGNAKDYIGVAENATILPLKCFSGTEGDLDDVYTAIEYAKEMNVNIINLSWESDIDDPQIYNIIKAYKDIIFVCSSGNRYRNIDVNPVYPAAYELDNVIAVAAINSTGDLCGDSGYGNRIDIAAPGENIFCNLPDDEKMYGEGTSLATAYITGCIAIILSNYPDLQPDEVKDILKKASTPLYMPSGQEYNFGLVNVVDSLKYAKNLKL